MSIVISIAPIETRTKDGTAARVTGIDMTSGDPYRGVLEVVSAEPRPVRWRVNGDMRDGYPGWNLCLDNPELEHLRAVAEKLGAR